MLERGEIQPCCEILRDCNNCGAKIPCCKGPGVVPNKGCKLLEKERTDNLRVQATQIAYVPKSQLLRSLSQGLIQPRPNLVRTKTEPKLTRVVKTRLYSSKEERVALLEKNYQESLRGQGDISVSGGGVSSDMTTATSIGTDSSGKELYLLKKK